ncbi:MAG: alkaline phosphatase D family protein, partial [Ferruginibacter sp.]
MLWMGDAWYTREVDFSTTWGLQKRVAQERRLPLLNNFMATMPQYFIWDDHDFGPNDAGKSFHLKKESRDVFKKYTLNPSYGEDEKGIYTKLSYSDVDLFLTDGRYFRSEDRLLDSIDSKPNSQKTFFGNIQMDWLKNSLVYSNATFKIIVSGSQVLNTATTAECMCNYSYEYNDLLQFITDQKIQGVLFFSGDRHHSEVIEKKRPETYSLYDVTISPLTAGVGTLRGAELNNPLRVKNTLVEAQNFGNISVSGPKNNRKLKVEFIGLKGNKLSEWEINEQELK